VSRPDSPHRAGHSFGWPFAKTVDGAPRGLIRARHLGDDFLREDNAPMDMTLQGKTGAVFSLPIEYGKICEFAEAIQSAVAAYREAAATYAPATFLTTSFFWERRVPGADLLEALALNPASAVHATQEYRFFGPPPQAGTVLSAQMRIDKLQQKTNKSGKLLNIAELVTEFRDGARLVAEGRMTIIEPEQTP
jgi:hypothetical protein